MDNSSKVDFRAIILTAIEQMPVVNETANVPRLLSLQNFRLFSFYSVCYSQWQCEKSVPKTLWRSEVKNVIINF